MVYYDRRDNSRNLALPSTASSLVLAALMTKLPKSCTTYHGMSQRSPKRNHSNLIIADVLHYPTITEVLHHYSILLRSLIIAEVFPQ